MRVDVHQGRESARVDPTKRLEGTLEAGSPATAVPELARALRTEGMKQAPMYRPFSTELQRPSGDDPRYDAVADTMDLIWGGPWAKGAALFDEELTDERLARE
jgi:hypothetical protein